VLYKYIETNMNINEVARCVVAIGQLQRIGMGTRTVRRQSSVSMVNSIWFIVCSQS
jgi:hypothetical protein